MDAWLTAHVDGPLSPLGVAFAVLMSMFCFCVLALLFVVSANLVRNRRRKAVRQAAEAVRDERELAAISYYNAIRDSQRARVQRAQQDARPEEAVVQDEAPKQVATESSKCPHCDQFRNGLICNHCQRADVDYFKPTIVAKQFVRAACCRVTYDCVVGRSLPHLLRRFLAERRSDFSAVLALVSQSMHRRLVCH